MSTIRFVDAMQDYSTFVGFCFLIRGFEALGASAFSTASYIFVVNMFPENIGAVLVGQFSRSDYYVPFSNFIVIVAILLPYRESWKLSSGSA